MVADTFSQEYIFFRFKIFFLDFLNFVGDSFKKTEVQSANCRKREGKTVTKYWWLLIDVAIEKH
jgi:hypothetical protein